MEGLASELNKLSVAFQKMMTKQEKNKQPTALIQTRSRRNSAESTAAMEVIQPTALGQDPEYLKAAGTIQPGAMTGLDRSAELDADDEVNNSKRAREDDDLMKRHFSAAAAVLTSSLGTFRTEVDPYDPNDPVNSIVRYVHAFANAAAEAQTTQLKHAVLARERESGQRLVELEKKMTIYDNALSAIIETGTLEKKPDSDKYLRVKIANFQERRQPATMTNVASKLADRVPLATVLKDVAPTLPAKRT